VAYFLTSTSLPEAQKVTQQYNSAPTYNISIETCPIWVEDEDENLKDCTQEMEDNYQKLQLILHNGACDSFNCILSGYSTKHVTKTAPDEARKLKITKKKKIENLKE
jgi:hypothetical protein